MGKLRLKEVKPFVQISSPSLFDSKAQLSPTAPQVIIPWCLAEVRGGGGRGGDSDGPKVTEQVHVGPGLHPRPVLAAAGAPCSARGLPSCASV